MDPLFTQTKSHYYKIEGRFNETEFDIKCELWPIKIVIGYKLNDITRENIVNYLKIYDINSTNKSNLIQIDDVMGIHFYIWGCYNLFIKNRNTDHLLNYYQYGK